MSQGDLEALQNELRELEGQSKVMVIVKRDLLSLQKRPTNTLPLLVFAGHLHRSVLVGLF
jgi:hypothetical protein